MIVGWRRSLSLPPTQSPPPHPPTPLLSNSLHFTWTVREMRSGAHNGLEVDSTDDKCSSSSIPSPFLWFFSSSTPLWLGTKWQMLMRDKLWDHHWGNDGHGHTHTHTHTHTHYARTHFMATQGKALTCTQTHGTAFIIILPASASNFRVSLLPLSGFLDRAIKAVYWTFGWHCNRLFLVWACEPAQHQKPL